MLSTSAFAETASLVGDPARANMLAALMDGRALTASELARAAGITPQTASGHLARMTEAGLLASSGRGGTATTVWPRGRSHTCSRASCRSRPTAAARR
jgi:DNA-binding transcriptional ArsR family regulator